MPRKLILPNGIPKEGQLWLPRMLSEQRRNWLLSLTTKDRVTETLVVQKEGKSWNQVKMIFGLVLATIVRHFDEFGWDTSVLFKLPEPTGIPVDENNLREYLYAACPLYDEDGKAIRLSETTAYTDNVAKWVDNIMVFAATQWHCYIPNPDPNWRANES